MDDATNKRIMPRVITDEEVKTVISWPLVMEAVLQALRAACRAVETEDLPISNQPPSTNTPSEEPVMLMTMPGYVENYEIGGDLRSTLACKFVTAVNEDETSQPLQPPLPSMQTSILLFDSSTGRIKSIMEGNKITTMTIAAASIIATKYIYFYKPDVQEQDDDCLVLSILGCGIQGRIHAIGFANCLTPLTEIRLWDNTFSEAESLAKELEALGEEFNIEIKISETVDDCVLGADVIVSATIGSEPLLQLNMIKSTAHINVIEDGVNHYCGLSEELYLKSNVYIDNWGSAQTEVKEGPQMEIVGLLGEVLAGLKPIKAGITVFRSMDMAANDAIVAEAVYSLIK